MLTIKITNPDGTTEIERSFYSFALLRYDAFAGDHDRKEHRWPDEDWASEHACDANCDLGYYEPLASLGAALLSDTYPNDSQREPSDGVK